MATLDERIKAAADRVRKNAVKSTAATPKETVQPAAAKVEPASLTLDERIKAAADRVRKNAVKSTTATPVQGVADAALRLGKTAPAAVRLPESSTKSQAAPATPAKSAEEKKTRTTPTAIEREMALRGANAPTMPAGAEQGMRAAWYSDAKTVEAMHGEAMRRLKNTEKPKTPYAAGATEDNTVPYAAGAQAAQSAKQKVKAEPFSKARQDVLDLASYYYQAENAETLSKLREDPVASTQYAAVGNVHTDLSKALSVSQDILNPGAGGEPAEVAASKDYIKSRYGLTDADFREYSVTGGGRFQQIIQDLEKQEKTLGDQLSKSGYDFRRLSTFEQSLKDAEEYAKKQAQREKAAKEDPALASLGTVFAAPLQGLDFVGTMLQGIGQSDPKDLKHYTPMNVYNMDITNAVNTVRSTVSKELEKKTNWTLFGKNVASFLYETGMSMTDSALQVSAFGPAATYLMGASAASSMANEIIQRGGSTDQAFWGGLAAGAAETFFEHFSVEQLLKPRDINGWKALLSETVKQGATEASEEIFTEIANILFDTANMGRRSEFYQAVEGYQRDQNVSKEEAMQKAFLDCVAQVAWAGAGGLVSGIGMGGAVSLENFSQYMGEARNTGRSLNDMSLTKEDLQAFVSEGLESDPDTQAYKLAKKLQKVLDKKGALSDTQLGRQYMANVSAIEAEESANQAVSAQSEESQTLGGVSGETQNLPAEGQTQEGDSAGIRVGKATVLKQPYKGETPVQAEKKETAPTIVPTTYLETAKIRIANAEKGAKDGVAAFKNLLTRAYKATFTPSRNVQVDGLTFRGAQYLVDINNSVPEKVISDVNHTAEKFSIIGLLPKIVQNGEYVGSTVGKKKITRYDHFESAVIIDGKSYLVLFQTEVYPDVNNYKTHRLIEMELIPQSGGLLETPSSPAEAVSTPKKRISQASSVVNKENPSTGVPESVASNDGIPNSVADIVNDRGTWSEPAAKRSPEYTANMTWKEHLDRIRSHMGPAGKAELTAMLREIRSYNGGMTRERLAAGVVAYYNEGKSGNSRFNDYWGLSKDHYQRAVRAGIADAVGEKMASENKAWEEHLDEIRSHMGPAGKAELDAILGEVDKYRGRMTKERLSAGIVAFYNSGKSGNAIVNSSWDLSRDHMRRATNAGMEDTADEKMMSMYGQEGRRVLRKALNDRSDTEQKPGTRIDVITGIGWFYASGRAGEYIDSFEAADKWNLTKEERFEAYKAGALDAEKEAESQRKKTFTAEKQRVSSRGKPIPDQVVEVGTDGYLGTESMEKLKMEPPSRPITDLRAGPFMRDYAQGAFRAKKELDRYLRQIQSDEGDQMSDRAITMARGILQGKFTLEDAEHMGLKRETVGGLLDRMEALETLKRPMKEQRERIYQRYDKEVLDGLLKDTDKWQPVPVPKMNFSTMQRTMERMTDWETARAINEELFDPVMENEGKRIRWVNQMLEPVGKLRLSEGESTAVQQLMEKKITLEDLKKDGIDTARIEECAKILNEMYREMYALINDFLTAHGDEPIGYLENYAPHSKPEEMMTEFQRIAQRLGFPAEVSELPVEIAGRTDVFRPNKQYVPNFQHRVGSETVYDAVGGAERYINYVSKVLFHMDDIMKLRRFNKAIRERCGATEISKKIDRLNTLDEMEYGAYEVLMTERSPESLKDELFKQLEDTTKLGGFVSVLENYTNILAGKQSKSDRAWESLVGRKALNWGKNIQNIFARSAVLGNISSALNQTVQLPQLVAEVRQKYILGAMRDVLTGKTGKTGFNRESNYLTGKRGVSQITPKTMSEKTMDVMGIPFEVVDDLASRIVVRAKYLEQINAGASHKEALRTADEYAGRLMGNRMKGTKSVLFEDKNMIKRAFTTFQLEVANGWDHIFHDLPQEIKILAASEGKTAAVKRTARLIFMGQIAAFVANMIFRAITGREPVPFDGIGMVTNYLADGYGLTKEEYMATVVDDMLAPETGGVRQLGTSKRGKFSPTAGLGGVAESVLDDVPIMGNITNALGITSGRLPLPSVRSSRLEKGFVNLFTESKEDETEEEKAERRRQSAQEILTGAAELAAGWIPGGNQIKKTVQGTGALVRGGVYTGYGSGERLKYPVATSVTNIAKGALFGKSAFPETDRFYTRKESTLTSSQTELYKQMIREGASGETVYDEMQRIKKAKTSAEKLDVLIGSKLEKKWKEMLYGGMISESRAEAAKEVMETGVSFNKYLEAHQEYLEINQVEGISATEKAANFYAWLNTQSLGWAQKKAIEDTFRYYYTMPATGGDYVKLREAGCDDKEATLVSQKLNELQPESGKREVTAVQKCRAILDCEMNTLDTLRGMQAVMDEPGYMRMVSAYRNTVPLDMYVTYRENLAKEDKVTQDAAKSVIDRMKGLTDKQRAVMWQMTDSRWASRNNPYDKDAGQKVSELYERLKG